MKKPLDKQAGLVYMNAGRFTHRALYGCGVFSLRFSIKEEADARNRMISRRLNTGYKREWVDYV